MSTSETNMPQMVIGDKFASWDEFKKSLALYERTTKQKFWIRSSHQIDKVHVKRALNKELKYYDAQYSCIHGGIKFKPRGQGERKSSTLKMDCPANVKLLASSCGKFLEIRSSFLVHENHELSSIVFEHLPQNRRLAPDEKAEAGQYLELGCDKKKLQNKIALETGKHPTLKDLTNIRSAMKKDNENDLIEAISLLENKYHATVTVLKGQDNHFKGLHFSTADMRNSMAAWPEIICIDGTYKLVAMDFTLMLYLVVDSNGLSEIAAASLIVHEDEETFRAILECFKNENLEACARINCFIGDKDLLERDLLKEIFGVPVYICLFHTLRIFARQITPERMGTTDLVSRQEILKLLEALAYSASEDDYAQKYETFCARAPEKVREYYDKNWHPIKNEWTHFSMTKGNLGNKTNNRLESINNKVKQVIKKRSILVAFINDFFQWLNSHKFERDHKAAEHVLKRPVTIFPPDSCEGRYLRYVTSDVFKHIIASIEGSQLIIIDNISKLPDDGQFEIKSQRGNVNTTSTSCSCGYWTSMLLPCDHIFAIRKLERLPLFDEKLIAYRWTREYYLATQRAFRDQQRSETTPSSPASVVTQILPKRVLTLSEKRKRASLFASSLVTLASLAPKSLYQCKLQVLRDIERFWREGFEVSVEKIERTRSGSDASSASQNSNGSRSIRDLDTQKLQSIPETIEEDDLDLEGDISESDIVNEILSSESDLDIDGLEDYLTRAANYFPRTKFDLEDNFTSPPESSFTTVAVIEDQEGAAGIDPYHAADALENGVIYQCVPDTRSVNVASHMEGKSSSKYGSIVSQVARVLKTGTAGQFAVQPVVASSEIQNGSVEDGHATVMIERTIMSNRENLRAIVAPPTHHGQPDIENKNLEGAAETRSINIARVKEKSSGQNDSIVSHTARPLNAGPAVQSVRQSIVTLSEIREGSSVEDGHATVMIESTKISNREILHAVVALDTTDNGQPDIENKNLEGAPETRRINIANVKEKSSGLNGSIVSHTARVLATGTASQSGVVSSEISKDFVENLLPDSRSTSFPKGVLENIIMPAPVRVRGRPKGATLTVIGLKRACAKKGAKSSKSRVRIAFKNRPARAQVEIMLAWCTTKEAISAALNEKYLIRESDVEQRPEFINNAILDENVPLHLLQDFMDEDAFESLIQTIQIKRNSVLWTCSVCHTELTGKDVVCDECLQWYHYTCVGCKRAPRKTTWFCPTCLA